ncbi:putative transcription repressor OFP13 [Iris pallida]|uniref:Transcription repressor n=1 Tax=Iris pallida TaxID=29817 RepID=A0AAX6FLU8_IRIPA|nr:putative transcription repressor OFP13 [Iris pallida]
MGKKKLGFTSLIFRLGDTTPAATTTATKPSLSSSSWAWPSCKQQPRTDSFRGGAVDESVYKTVNSVYFDSTDSFFTHSSEDNNSESSAMSVVDANDGSESLIRGLVRSSADRLFVEPGGDTSSILEEAKGCGGGSRDANPFRESSVAMAMESHDPYLDFKKSMEEMVAAHGMKDWECLEELLVWYLRVNGKKTHGYIVGAFVDLLVGLAADARGEEEVESGDLLCSSSCGSSSLSLSSSRNCYEIEEVEEGSASC